MTHKNETVSNTCDGVVSSPVYGSNAYPGSTEFKDITDASTAVLKGFGYIACGEH